MIVRTKTKILLAGMVQRVLMTARELRGKGPVVVCRRGGLYWRLDLREGIDFAIFLLGSFERSTVASYRRLLQEGSVVIDIGANIGAHTLPLAASVGESGLVVAVEPTRYAFERLMDQITLNEVLRPRIHAYQLMLMGRRDASLVEALPSSWPLSASDGAHEQHGGISKDTKGAAVTTLDALVKKEGLQRIDLIKLDVDGFEIEVMQGAQNVLSDFGPPIIFEHSPYSLAEKGYDPGELVEILRKAGYRFNDLKGEVLGVDGTSLPDVPVGAGFNVLARRR